MLTKADLAAWVALQAQMVYAEEDEASPAWEQSAEIYADPHMNKLLDEHFEFGPIFDLECVFSDDGE